MPSRIVSDGTKRYKRCARDTNRRPSRFRDIKTKDASDEAGGRNQLARLGVRAAAAFYRRAAAAAAGLTGTRLSYLTLRKVSAPNINMQKL